MHLVQLLLPIYGADGRRIPPEHYAFVRAILTETYGGVTAYHRAPAKGLWREDDGEVVADEILINEVMVDGLDHAWWAEFREALRRGFDQEELVVRALPMERL